MKRLGFAVAVLACCMVFIACGKRYVGNRIDASWPGWCHYLNGEKHCTKEIGALVFDFVIKEGPGEGEFIIEGVIDPTQKEIKSWDRMIPEKSRFSMIVANDGVVVDSVSFRPRTAYGGIGQKLPFRIQYTRPEGFDAITFDWELYLRG